MVLNYYLHACKSNSALSIVALCQHEGRVLGLRLEGAVIHAVTFLLVANRILGQVLSRSLIRLLRHQPC